MSVNSTGGEGGQDNRVIVGIWRGCWYVGMWYVIVIIILLLFV